MQKNYKKRKQSKNIDDRRPRKSAFVKRGKELDYDVEDIIETNVNMPLKDKVSTGYVRRGQMTADQKLYGSNKKGKEVKAKLKLSKIRKDMKNKYPSLGKTARAKPKKGKK